MTPDVRSLARRAYRKVKRVLLRRVPAVGLPSTDWARAEPAPDQVHPLPSFRFFAILGTWYEADVIEATVKNAFVQGCERVYLVDNDSPDDTVARAVAAGATLARTFATEVYEEDERMRIMNAVVAEVSEQTAEADEDSDHIWWLWLDADEFHHGPQGLTLIEYLSALDRRFRVVGARFFNHYPDRVPEYEEGRHPLDFQPLCEEHVYPMCTRGHRKHPLQRWDRDGNPIVCGAGFHQASSTATLIEPLQHIYLHHFPYRREAVSRRRLEALCQTDADGLARAGDRKVQSYQHIVSRFASFDAVYRHDWEHVENLIPGHPLRGVLLDPWNLQVPNADLAFARWYDAAPASTPSRSSQR